MADDHKEWSRRRFLTYAVGAATGAGIFRFFGEKKVPFHIRKRAENALRSGLAIVHGNHGDQKTESQTVSQMAREAIQQLGGMERLVRPGARVVIKPNMAWPRPPHIAASTNPYVVRALVSMCLEAGADRVRVLDHTIAPNPEPAYRISGIAEQAREAGAQVVTTDPGRFREVAIPGGFELHKWSFYEEFISREMCDVLINVPVLKDHGTSRLTIGLKNAFGMVGGERGQLHSRIHRKIPDLHRIIKVDLTVMDAYRVIRQNGPTGGREADVDNSLEGARRIVASADPVAVDSYGASMFGLSPDEVEFVRNAEKAGLGGADWHGAGVRERTI
ncbi:MAG: DUF362 domain-containing protein [Candidatus Brocadiia bacterium]